jgi:hypothetical protein
VYIVHGLRFARQSRLVRIRDGARFPIKHSVNANARLESLVEATADIDVSERRARCAHAVIFEQRGLT